MKEVIKNIKGNLLLISNDQDLIELASKNKNIDLLLEYAKIFNIYDKVNTIVEIMMGW